MFAVSAMSVQNVNAQDDVKVNTKSTQAVNEPKDKPQDNGAKTLTPSSNNQKPTMRAAQNPKGHNDVKAEKTNKSSKPKIVKDKNMKNDAKADQKKDDQKKQGKEAVFEKKDHKPSKPQIVKDKKTNNNAQSAQQNANQNAQGKEQKPAIVKPNANDKIENNAQSAQQNANQNVQGKEKPSIVKPNANDKIENNVQANEVKDDQNKEGYYNANNKNVDPTVKKENIDEPQNNVVRPKEKVGEGTGTQNNNGVK